MTAFRKRVLRNRTGRIVVALVVSSLLAAGCATITRGSETSSGAPATSSSYQPALSNDGRYLTFTSTASNLAGTDQNSTHDVFVRDQQTKAVELISVATTGGQSGNSASDRPSISADGRFVAFRSLASNLVAGDANGAADIFVRDRQAGTTTRVSIASAGTEANNTSDTPAISADGHTVVFASMATNLVAGDTNGTWDVFARDLAANTTTLVSVPAAGGIANQRSAYPTLSSNGRYVAFGSLATNLVTGDTNGVADVFVRDRVGATTTRASLATGTGQANGASSASSAPSISSDGRYVAFDSAASNLVSADTNATTDVFVRDRTAATTARVSTVSAAGAQGNGPSDAPTISATGRFVAFESRATNLISGDTNSAVDVFARDRVTNATTRVSTSTTQGQGTGPSGGTASISGDERSVAFQSGAPNLIDSDANAADDVFTRYLTVPTIAAVTPSSVARGASATLAITGSGFLPGAIVMIPVTGAGVGTVTIQSESHLTVNVSIASNATPATVQVWVTLLGTGLGADKAAVAICSCLTIS